MRRSIGELARVLLVAAVFAVWMLSSASDVSAQQATEFLAQQIQGSWTLVSMYNEQDGRRTELFGSNPKGSMILTPDGRFSIIIMRANLPKFASKNRTRGTMEENEAVVQGSIAYFGRYKVAGEKELTMEMTIEGSSFPNYDGEVQKRFLTLTGDEMRFVNPTTALGSGTNYLIWKRAK